VEDDGQSSELVTDDDGGEAEPEPTDEPEELPTATPEPTATSEPEEVRMLLVSEDALSGRTDFTSADEIAESLDSLGIEYDRQATKDGYPSVAEMLEYTGVIWSAGDDCCDTQEVSPATVSEYLDEGGNLFIEGGTVAYAWQVSGLTQYIENLGVVATDFTPMGDIVLVTEHPVTEGFDSAPIQLQVSSSIPPDVVEPIDDTVVLFERGPNSASRGEAAMVAYETDDTKFVFSAASIQWMPPAAREQLLQNIVGWFSQ
jgi:hypothetical protein